MTVAPYQHATRNLPSDTPNLAHLPASGRGQIIIIIHIIPYNEQLILKQLFASSIGTQNAATFIRRQNLNNGPAEGSVAPVRTYQTIRARGRGSVDKSQLICIAPIDTPLLLPLPLPLSVIFRALNVKCVLLIDVQIVWDFYCIFIALSLSVCTCVSAFSFCIVLSLSWLSCAA